MKRYECPDCCFEGVAEETLSGDIQCENCGFLIDVYSESDILEDILDIGFATGKLDDWF